MRILTSAFAFITATMAPASIAEACSCTFFASSPAALERAAEEAYRAADLIAIASVGPVSADYETRCAAGGTGETARTGGVRIARDRPFMVIRHVKGKASAAPVLADTPGFVMEKGCRTPRSTCDVDLPVNGRSLLILKRLPDGRYESMGYCAWAAISESKFGQALFARGG